VPQEKKMLDLEIKLEVPKIYFEDLYRGDWLIGVNRSMFATAVQDNEKMFVRKQISDILHSSQFVLINPMISEKTGQTEYFIKCAKEQTMFVQTYYTWFSNREAAINYAAEEVKLAIARNNKTIVILTKRNTMMKDKFKLSKL
jgi:hypothetical protein